MGGDRVIYYKHFSIQDEVSGSDKTYFVDTHLILRIENDDWTVRFVAVVKDALDWSTPWTLLTVLFTPFSCVFLITNTSWPNLFIGSRVYQFKRGSSPHQTHIWLPTHTVMTKSGLYPFSKKFIFQVLTPCSDYDGSLLQYTPTSILITQYSAFAGLSSPRTLLHQIAATEHCGSVLISFFTSALFEPPMFSLSPFVEFHILAKFSRLILLPNGVTNFWWMLAYIISSKGTSSTSLQCTWHIATVARLNGMTLILTVDSKMNSCVVNSCKLLLGSVHLWRGILLENNWNFGAGCAGQLQTWTNWFYRGQ